MLSVWPRHFTPSTQRIIHFTAAPFRSSLFFRINADWTAPGQMIDKSSSFPANSMLGAGKLCHRVACQFNGLEPHILMEAMGTVMFDIDLSECCVVSPSLSDSSSQCYQRLLENGSSVFCCWNTLSIRSIQCHHAPHASMIMFSSVCCPLAWVFMKNALRIALCRSFLS